MSASSVLTPANAILAPMLRLPLGLSRWAMTMRFSTVAATLCLGLSPVLGSAATPAQLVDAPPAAPGAAAKPASAAPVPASDAAAKHAKRTACLKDAKTKKLVGADKTSFLKNCIAAP
jgi:hypothetical protein